MPFVGLRQPILPTAVQKPHQPVGNGSRIQPATVQKPNQRNGSKTPPKKRQKERQKKQQEPVAAGFDKVSFSRLENQGFDDAAARNLSGNHSRESIEQQVRLAGSPAVRATTDSGCFAGRSRENWSEPTSAAKDSEQEKLNRERGRHSAKDFAKQQQDKQTRLKRTAALRKEWQRHSTEDRTFPSTGHRRRQDSRRTPASTQPCVDLGNPPSCRSSQEMMARDRGIPLGDSSHISVSPTTRS